LCDSRNLLPSPYFTGNRLRLVHVRFAGLPVFFRIIAGGGKKVRHSFPLNRNFGKPGKTAQRAGKHKTGNGL
jgi:hypothetical protein